MNKPRTRYKVIQDLNERIKGLENVNLELSEELIRKVEALGRFHEKNFDFMEKEEQIIELEAALQKYGRHTGSCTTRFIDTDIDPTGNTFGKCDCGFEQALKGK